MNEKLERLGGSKEEREKKIAEFKKLATKRAGEAKIAEAKARDFIKNESWETFRALVCYAHMPTNPQDDTLFCLGLQGWREGRSGSIGVIIKTIEGFYKSAFPCPYWNKLDCPLRERLARKEEEKRKQKEVGF